MNPSQTAAQLAPTSKPTTGAGGGSPFSSPQLFYEPTSVLEPHHLDSSPASDQLANAGGWDHNKSSAAKYAPNPAASFVPAADDWDPLTCWLLDKDAIGPGELDYDGEVHHPAHPHPPPTHQFPFDHNTDAGDPFDFLAPPYSNAASEHLGAFGPSQSPLLQPAALPPPPPPPAFEQVHLEQLIRAAHAAEAGDRGGACAILARLNQQLPSPAGRPFQRAAFYFKDALQSLLLDDVNQQQNGASSPVEVVRRIAAYKALCDLSPVPQFASFTTNQTVLEALVPPKGSAVVRALHLVDFDIGLGGQWASFVHEFAARCRLGRGGAPTPPLRVTAVVLEETLETRLVAENLREFAASLGVRLAFDVVPVGDSGPAALGAVQLTAGESLAISFTPAITRLLGGRGAEDSFGGFIRFVRRASPKVVVFVDPESGCCPPPQYPHSFRSSFIAGLQYYSAVLESLDAASGGCSGTAAAESVRRIERALLQPRVRDAVRSSWARPPRWRDMLQAAGLRPMAFSKQAEIQAEYLTRRFPVAGYNVARSDGELVLVWKEIVIASTSAWHC